MKVIVLILGLVFAAPSAAIERFCFDDDEPGKLWISGTQVLGDALYGPYVLSEDFVDRCYEGEIPRLAALSRVMASMPNICRISKACQYDLDQDGSVGLDDVGALIKESLVQLNAVCR